MLLQDFCGFSSVKPFLNVNVKFSPIFPIPTAKGCGIYFPEATVNETVTIVGNTGRGVG